MSGDLITRTATTFDIGLLVALNGFVQALHAEAHPDIFVEKLDPAAVSGWFAAAIADPEQRVWLAELHGNVAGYLVLRLVRRGPNPFKFADIHGLIDQIGIDPKARRRGLGRALIETARRFLRDQGITRVRAEHWAFNQGAAAFFASEGLDPLRISSDGPVDR
jgi:ribosomal protein S18 acetylase RimI-like enzyme